MIVVIFYISAFFIGSILNDIIDYYVNREQDNQQVSKCTHCHHPLKWYDKIPVISYLLTFGKCRYCKKSISVRYPLVEVLSAVNFLIAYHLYGENIQALYLYILYSLLVVLSVIDLLLNKVPLKFMIIIIGLAFLSIFTNNNVVLLDRICAIFLVSIPLLLLSRIKKGSIGEADIIFCACSGFLLGMWGILFTACVAYILAGIYSLIMLLLGKLNKKSKVAMFPFFYLAIVTFFGYAIDLIQITLR